MRRVVAIVAAVALAGFATVASADDVSVGASISYGLDLNDPASGSGNSSVYGGMNANDESFGVDLVQVGVSGSRGDVSYAAAINFGDLASAADDTDSGDSAQLAVANIAYDAGGVTVTAGRFGTPIGYEVLEPWGNGNISRSYGWQAQPINHDGVTVSTAVGDADLTLGVVNNFTVADTVGNDADDEMGFIAALGTSVGDWSLNLSGIVTEEADTTDITMGNLILSGELGGMPLAIEANYREDDATTKTEMTGIALYTSTSIGGADLDLRFDFIDDEGITTSADTEVWAVTVTASWALADGVDLRLEYRHDDADDAIFNDDSSGGTDDALDTVQAQLVWNP